MGVKLISNYNRANSVLSMSSIAFSACFAVWVIFSIIGIPLKAFLDLTEIQFGLLLSMPILSGSLLRLPMAALTDRHGGRNVFAILLASILVPLYLIGSATEYWQLLVLGLFVGVAAASFTAGMTYTTRWYPSARQGLLMGGFEVGNVGTALIKIIAPTVIAVWAWQTVPQFYAIAMIVVVILFWMFTYQDPNHKSIQTTSLGSQLRLIKDPKIWKYCQYYSLVFGGFVGVSLWITKYYVNEYDLDLTTAVLLAIIFVLSSGIVRLLGGWLSDKYGAYIVTWSVLWVSWVALFLLSYPQTSMTIKVLTGDDWQFSLGMNVWVFTAIIFVLGMAWGLGKASVFKALADEFPDDFAVASGIVGLAGGMGGFLLLILFGFLIDLTRVNSSIFMLLYGATCVSLVLMYFTFGRAHEAKVIQTVKDDIHGQAALDSMSKVVEKQRKSLTLKIEAALVKCSSKLSNFIGDLSQLEDKLSEFQKNIGHYKAVYILNANGRQITANLTPDGRDEKSLGRDRSKRPYMQGMFGDEDFKLSESYISRNKKRPSLTAVHVIRDHNHKRIAFLCVDYDLRSLPRSGILYQGSKEWQQLKGDPSIRGGLFAQKRTQSVMDEHLDDVLYLLEELILEHGVFQWELYFSSSRATIWHMDDPYSYHLLDIAALIDPDICLAYPQRPYHQKATVPSLAIKKIIEQFKQLRYADETIYLRSASLNVINGMVSLNFSCDGSHYMNYEEFLEKDMSFWFGI